MSIGENINAMGITLDTNGRLSQYFNGGLSALAC